MCHTILCPTLNASQVEKAVTLNTVPYLINRKVDMNTYFRNIFKISYWCARLCSEHMKHMAYWKPHHKNKNKFKKSRRQHNLK
jgi:hypothetical protein